MNIQQFRQSVRDKWLSYYAENRQWIIHLQVWVNCDGQRRPASSFILATLAVLEPQFNQLLPLIVDLSNNPDRIVAALGLNFNPDHHPEVAARTQMEATQVTTGTPKIVSGVHPETNHAASAALKYLPSASSQTPLPMESPRVLSQIDETCQGEEHRRIKPHFY